MVPAPPPTNPERVAALDVARGTALLAMALYHLGWDLSFLQLVAFDVADAPGWQIAARLIAGSFLVLAGMSLTLAHGRGVRWRAFLRRWVRVAGAAALVTAATALAVPGGLIFFGILHCIAAASVLALPFLGRPAWAVAAALLVLAVWLLVSDPAFDAPWLLWTGLGPQVPATNDYVPLFPWFAPVLAGLAAAEAGRSVLARLAAWRPGGGIARALALAGRHSLVVYLVHQPLLLAVLVPVALLLGPSPAAVEAGFARSFTARCEAAGAAPGACRAVLNCSLGRLQGTEGWARVLRGEGRSEDDRQVRDVTLACYGEVLPGPSGREPAPPQAEEAAPAQP